MLLNLCSISAASSKSNSGRRRSGTSRRIASTTLPTIRSRPPAAACWARAARRRGRRRPQSGRLAPQSQQPECRHQSGGPAYRHRAPQQRGRGEVGVFAGIALRAVPPHSGGVLHQGVQRSWRRGVRSVHGERDDDGGGGRPGPRRVRLRDKPCLLRRDRAPDDQPRGRHTNAGRRGDVHRGRGRARCGHRPGVESQAAGLAGHQHHGPNPHYGPRTTQHAEAQPCQ